MLEADGATAASRCAAGHAGPIDVVITDFRIPGMDGRELARQILRIRPGARILFISGYLENLQEHGTGPSFLQKPFTREQLSAALRRLHELPV